MTMNRINRLWIGMSVPGGLCPRLRRDRRAWRKPLRPTLAHALRSLAEVLARYHHVNWGVLSKTISVNRSLNTGREYIVKASWLFIVAVFAVLLPQLAQAQAWPQRPVTVVVGYSPGGSTDVQARIITERLTSAFGQPFVVANRLGAGGAIGAEVVARAPADGYTLLFGVTPQLLTVPLIQKVSYDPLKDFAPISVLGTNPFVLGINVSVPAKTVKEFVDYVKAQPGQLNYGSGGIGTMAHLSAAMFVSRAGLKMTHIPYKGFSLAVGDLVSGLIQMYFGNVSDMLQLARSGKTTLLAVSSEKRAPQLLDVPAMAEIYPGFRTYLWSGLLAPAGTPRDIIERTAQEVARAVREPAMNERLTKNGIDPLGNTPAEFAELIRSEMPMWRAAVDAAGIKQK